jgi:uncharacterized protein with NRDE domain
MCLVFLAFQVSDAHPVMLAANREESRSRPGTFPVCPLGCPLHALVAGADHGPDGSFPEIGTWLGVNETGLVVAVTNRRDGALAWADQTRSRGLLAVALLGFPHPAQAAAFAQHELACGGFGGCNYLIASRDAAFVIHAPGARQIGAMPLAPGVHALTNLDLNDGADPRIRSVRENLDPAQFIASAARICRDPRTIVDGLDRGTVSSSMVLVGDDIRFYHIRGDPRDSAYELFHPFDHGPSTPAE